MTYRLLSILNAIVLAGFGAAFLVMPQFMLDLFGVETYTATLFVARFFGAAMALAGMFVWMAKDLVQAERTMTIMLLVSSIAGFILTLVGVVVDGVIRSNGWVLMVIHIIFVLGYGYLVSGVTVVRKNQ
jgi:hypothetical protein